MFKSFRETETVIYKKDSTFKSQNGEKKNSLVSIKTETPLNLFTSQQIFSNYCYVPCTGLDTEMRLQEF